MVASGQVVTFQLWRPVWGKVYLVSGSLRGGGGVFRAVTDSGGHYTSRPDPGLPPTAMAEYARKLGSSPKKSLCGL